MEGCQDVVTPPYYQRIVVLMKDNNNDKKTAYQFIKKILLDVQDLSVDEQASYVKKACESKPEHIPSLLNMLNIGNSEFAEVMEKPAILEHIPEVDTQPSSKEPALPAGTIISHYKIIDKIGAGGMGNVYSAQQNYPAERKVALKLLKKSPNQQLIITETQILARLNHPNIATLYEIDQSKDGQFFIAMELIIGEDMIRWCQSHQYSNTQIIKLFQQLCSGISYAHGKNIIHCDIKPNNVLVTDIDGSATVKIIDFGISQFEDQQESYHEISGTPAYLAPEVLSNKGTAVTDSRRDVYALGVLLKKLLPLTLPLDLQAIIDKAMAHDTEQRYQSTLQLNNDLSRYLNKQTVSARESNVWYVTKLLIQRRFEMFLVIALILIGSLVSGYVSQMNQAKIATQQAQAAKTAQHEAEELTGFLTDLFDVANPERSNSEIVTAVDLINKAKNKLVAIKQPSLSDARFMHTIGSIYTRMDQLEDAKVMIEQSLEVKEKFLKKTDNELIAGYTQLGLINKKLGQYQKAEQLLLSALKSLKKQSQPDTVQLAYIHNHLGNLYTATEQINKSIAQHELAVQLRLKKKGTKLLADSYNNLGVIYNNTKQWDKASKYINLALKYYILNYDVNHPYLGVVKNNLALIEENRFNFEVSEKLYLEVWDNWLQSYGKGHINTITIQRNLALYYNHQMQYAKAIKVFNGLIKHFQTINDLEKTAKYTGLMALSQGYDGQIELSINNHNKTLELIKDLKLKEKYLYARIHNQYAIALILAKDFDRAEAVLKLSIKQLSAKYTADNHSLLYTLNLLADLYFQKGELKQAKEMFHQVLKQNKPTQNNNQIRQISALIGLGKIHHQQKDLKKAQDSFQQALVKNKKIYKEIHKTNAIVYFELAKLKLTQGDSKQAKELLTQALAIQKIALPPKHKDLLATVNLLKSL